MSTCVPHQPATWPVDADGGEANLCEVHEAARQFLRYRGIDKGRQGAALVRMVNATEAVKDYDAGTAG
jgi:hypothetical protein